MTDLQALLVLWLLVVPGIWLSTRLAPYLQRRGRERIEARLHYIAAYRFPDDLVQTLPVRLKSMGAHDPAAAAEIAWFGLRTYFALHALGDGRTLGMPSVVVDEAWHRFLESPAYGTFCRHACGRVITHAPEPAQPPVELRVDQPFNAGARATAALLQHARHTRRHPLFDQESMGMPLLFAADRAAGVAGWIWSLPAYLVAAGENRTLAMNMQRPAAAARVAERAGSRASGRSTGATSSAGAYGSTYAAASSVDASSSACSTDAGSCGGGGSSCGGGCGGS